MFIFAYLLVILSITEPNSRRDGNSCLRHGDYSQRSADYVLLLPNNGFNGLGSGLSISAGFRQFLLRGIRKVRGEWALVCATHNI
jgi:hypothetical protein